MRVGLVSEEDYQLEKKAKEQDSAIASPQVKTSGSFPSSPTSTTSKPDLLNPQSQEKLFHDKQAESAARDALVHLGLVGEEEYEKEVAKSSGASSPELSRPKVEATESPAIAESETHEALLRVESKLRDLLCLGLLSKEEYEQQRRPLIAADLARSHLLSGDELSSLATSDEETEEDDNMRLDEELEGEGGKRTRGSKRKIDSDNSRSDEDDFSEDAA